MAFKAVHCADIHIGGTFSHLPSALASIRREEVNGSFLNLIKYCKEKSVDALLICGDLFDCPVPTKTACDFVKKTFESLSPIPVFIIAGNHDYINPDSPYSKDGYFSDNVHIFPAFEYSFEIPEKNVVIHGKSYISACETGFEKAAFDCDKINILCLHGDISSSGDYCAIKKETLSSIPCSYAALGHIHDGYIFEVGQKKCAYSGSLEAHGFDDCGRTGFIYAEIDKDGASVTHIPSSSRRYKQVSYDITGQDTENILLGIKKIINSEDLYRITLVGEFTDEINISVLKDNLSSSSFHIEIFDNSTPGYDFDSIEQEESLRGEFLRRLRLICTSEEEFILSGKAGLDALSGRIPVSEVEL